MSFDLTETQIACARPRSRVALPVSLLLAVSAVFVWSGADPHDPERWWAAASVVLLGIGVLVSTARRFPLTGTAYVLSSLLASSLLVAAHYPPGGVPFTGGIRSALNLTVDPFELFSKVLQGFSIALLVREILLRKSPLLPGRWLSALVVATSLAVFDLVAVLLRGADAFLLGKISRATGLELVVQPADMALVLLGAVLSLAVLRRSHDRQLVSIWLDVTRRVNWHRV